MSNESTNIIETMAAELEHLRPMEASLEMAEADVKAYKQRIAVLEKEVERLQRYHDAEATKWLAENQKLKEEIDSIKVKFRKFNDNVCRKIVDASRTISVISQDALMDFYEKFINETK